MNWNFLIGFVAGIISAGFFIYSEFYTYRRKEKQARRNIDRLERFNSDLQFEIKQMSNSNENNIAGLGA